MLPRSCIESTEFVMQAIYNGKVHEYKYGDHTQQPRIQAIFDGVFGFILLMLQILHAIIIIWYHNYEGMRYFGPCRIFSIHHVQDFEHLLVYVAGFRLLVARGIWEFIGNSLLDNLIRTPILYSFIPRVNEGPSRVRDP